MTKTAAVTIEHRDTRPESAVRLLERLRIRIGMATCVLLGHTVDWGPCPRCHRRALG